MTAWYTAPYNIKVYEIIEIMQISSTAAEISWRKILIQRIKADHALASPGKQDWVEVRSPAFGTAPANAWSFTGLAELLVPDLVTLPSRTGGYFTEIALDLNAPFFPQRPDQIFEVDLTLRGEVLCTKTFRNFTQRHFYIISTQLLFEPTNVLHLVVRKVAGDVCQEPSFMSRVFYVNQRRLADTMEKNAVFIFSTARSGSTWLSHDILCGLGGSRPMDEPGLGKIFAPIDWVAERFYDLAGKPEYFESGMDHELKRSPRTVTAFIPPFERSFLYARQENQIWSSQNWRMYLKMVRTVAFDHVVNEWGVLDYERVVFKMPNDSHAADVIMEAFPAAFFIFLMRDGRDVLKSRFSAFASQTLAETEDEKMRAYAIAFYSHFWNFQVDIMEAAYSRHAPDRRLLLHYERMRRDPTLMLREMLVKLGQSVSDHALAELIAKTTLENISAEQKGPSKPRQTGLIGKYRSVFSISEVELMESIMGPNLLKFGYELSTAGHFGQ